jgi:DNA processing protein
MHSNLLPWLHLKSVPGIGNLLCRRLLRAFGTPEDIFRTSCGDLMQIQGISRRLAETILSHPLTDSVQRDYDRTKTAGCSILPFNAPDYPPLLRHIPDPPPFLYVKGCLDGMADYIAVVGSRNPTSYGRSTARRLCRDLSAMQFVIVSGMALGIDTAAHQGAISGKGKTVAVLGSGLGNPYPPENAKLFDSICENGAVISEFPFMTGPDAHHFPMRNRIISGMTHGTVVVEAAQKSGSLITARMALEQNREVFAVPGSIYSFKSTGPHRLIKQGAKLTENAHDIFEELQHVIRTSDTRHQKREPATNISPSRKKNGLSPDEARVLATLEPYPVQIDELCRKLSLKPGELAGILMKLEILGIVTQSPGKRFSIKEDPT